MAQRGNFGAKGEILGLRGKFWPNGGAFPQGGNFWAKGEIFGLRAKFLALFPKGEILAQVGNFGAKLGKFLG